jgi:uncharacterized protein
LMYSFGEDKSTNDAVALAKRKGFGVIAMKTTRGAGRMSQDPAFLKTLPAGTTPYNTLVRWLMAQPSLDGATINTASLSQFVENYSGLGAGLRTEDHRALAMMLAYADTSACRLCNECMPHCAEKINIADILRYERYARDYRDPRRARHLYSKLSRQADACTACRACVPNCPQGLNIPAKLAETHRLLA